MTRLGKSKLLVNYKNGLITDNVACESLVIICVCLMLSAFARSLKIACNRFFISLGM